MCAFVGIYYYGNLEEVDEKLLVRIPDTMAMVDPMIAVSMFRPVKIQDLDIEDFL